MLQATKTQQLTKSQESAGCKRLSKAGNQRLGFFDLVCVFTRRSMCWQWLSAACSGRHPTLESGRLAESYALLLKSLGS